LTDDIVSRFLEFACWDEHTHGKGDHKMYDRAAQRILAESLARALGPKGVHVAYVVTDAVIDVPWTRKAFPDRPDDFFIQPSGIADAVHHVVHQERSAWTFELDLRPFGENW